MNRQDYRGYARVLSKAFKWVPAYKKKLREKTNQGMFDEIEDIEKLFTDNNLAEILLKETQQDKEMFTPAMLAWLHFGKSFERMVEQGEELRRNPNVSFLKRFAIASGIRWIIARSIQLGMRTKEDWKKHRELMRMVESDEVMDWAIDEAAPDEKKKAGRKRNEGSLMEMFSDAVPEALLSRIGEYLQSKHTNQDIARLKIALEESNYFSRDIDVKSFREALHEQYGDKITIVGVRGIQQAYKDLTSFVGSASKGLLVKDGKEERKIINSIKAFLSE
jgi:hypothetical protein